MNRRVRRGFTLVELLVVITIIGMLMALLMPAIQAAREAGRRATCMNNQKNLSLALLNYESRRRAFPGWQNYLGKDSAGTEVITSWVVPILPNLERNDLYELYRDVNVLAANKPGVVDGQYEDVYLRVLICPSDPPTGMRPSAYVVNAGRPDNTGVCPHDLKHNGVFHDLVPSTTCPADQIPKVSLDYISQRDGAQNTLMLSEGLLQVTGVTGDERTWVISPGVYGKEGELGFLWGEAAGTLVDLENTNFTCADPNGPSADDTDPVLGNPCSRHGGGVVVAYCGGNVTFLNDNLDYRVYQHLMTPDGREARKQIYSGLFPDDQGKPNLYGVLSEGDL